MPSMVRTSMLGLALTFGVAGVASAQAPADHLFRKGNLTLTISAGGAAFSAFQRATERPDTGAGRFERRLSAGTTGAVGADVLWWGGRLWGLRAHLSYMPSRFAVEHDREGEEWLRAHTMSARLPTYGRLRIWAADVSALIRPPFTLGRVATYGILGAGLVSYRPQSERALPPEAAAAFTGGARTSPAAVAGLGALVPLQKGDLLLSFVLTDHVTRTPVKAPAATTTWRDSHNRSSVDPGPAVRFTSNVRLLLGLTIPVNSR